MCFYQLLNDLEEHSFTEEDVDKEYEEFLQLQEELAQIRDDTSEIFKARELTKQPDSILAIEVNSQIIFSVSMYQINCFDLFNTYWVNIFISSLKINYSKKAHFFIVM